MIDTEGILFQRTEVNNTETPRCCHLIALKQAGEGLTISEIVKENVLASAERGKNGLEKLIDEFNGRVKTGNLNGETKKEYVSKLLGVIIFSYGIDGPHARRGRFEHLAAALRTE